MILSSLKHSFCFDSYLVSDIFIVFLVHLTAHTDTTVRKVRPGRRSHYVLCVRTPSLPASHLHLQTRMHSSRMHTACLQTAPVLVATTRCQYEAYPMSHVQGVWVYHRTWDTHIPPDIPTSSQTYPPHPLSLDIPTHLPVRLMDRQTPVKALPSRKPRLRTVIMRKVVLRSLIF